MVFIGFLNDHVRRKYGLDLLRSLGYSGIAADGSIFAQEQIARAVELGQREPRERIRKT